MANIKPAHMKQDSNPYRQKKNEEQKQLMKEQFKQIDLLKVPKGIYVKNKVAYKAMVKRLISSGSAIHLREADFEDLAALSNLYEDLFEAQKAMAEEGPIQPYISARNTSLQNINSLKNRLQIDVKSRQLLAENVSEDVEMTSISIKKSEGSMSANLLSRIK